jgi:DNA polymerase-3 subunit alpha
VAQFVHLHNHTAYSLLDGACRPGELVARAAQLDMPAIALTDHGVLYAGFEFYKEAQAQGIKPILGCEVYVAPQSRHQKAGRQDEGGYHLVLLAENYQGYQNLLKLISAAHTEGFYYKPRVDKELLAQHREGLIALTACLAGEVPRQIQVHPSAGARALETYLDIFGPHHLYLELQDHGLPEQREINAVLIHLGEKYNLPVVATNDVHYLRREDALAHDVLLCLQTGKTIGEENRMRFPTPEFYLKSASEMYQLFGQHPAALAHTLEIAERCNLTIPRGKIHLPTFPTPSGQSPEELLREGAYAGARRIYRSLNEAITQRLEHELNVINSMGYASYFLIVADFVAFARERQILVGPGRGSAASSLTAYCLGITQIDPLEYGLIFERFLNPDRVSLPDIDIDFADDRRGEIIDYVVEKYGRDQVAQIITFGTMAARAVIRDVGRVLELPYQQVDALAKQIPNEPGIKLSSLPPPETQWEELWQIALALEGLPRHVSVHAAGVVIADGPLDCYVPLQLANDGGYLTQYPMEDLEELGLVKMDFLGLRTLTVIAKARELVERNHGVALDLQSLSLTDGRVYDLLCSGATAGVFQMESRLFRSLLQDIKPRCFNDLIAILALGRPGPMHRVQDYIARKAGRSPINYLHPSLESILEPTYGVMIYQEQVMAIAMEIAGYTPAQADLLRRAMGKKDREIMEGERERFIQGAQARGLSPQVAQAIFEDIEEFAGYGFNKAHSAAYARIAYTTAYLKAHYPLEFMAALLNSWLHMPDKVGEYIGDCRQMGIEVLPPDINESGVDFQVVGGRLRFGLGAVKNVGPHMIEEIIDVRQEGPFTSLYDLCHRTSGRRLNRKAVESLIRGGAFDGLHPNRAQALAILDLAWERGERCHGQTGLFDLPPPPPDVPGFTPQELLAMEKEALGLYISGHPLDGLADLRRRLQGDTWEQLAEQPEGSAVLLLGLLTAGRRVRTKRGDQMYFGQLEDGTGRGELVVFPALYGKIKDRLVTDRLVLLQGRLEKGDESLQVVVEDLISFTARPLIIDLGASQGLGELKNLLRRHRGNRPVIFQIQRAGQRVFILAAEDYWVGEEPTLMEALEALGFPFV